MKDINIAEFVQFVAMIWFLPSWFHGVTLARKESFIHGVFAFTIIPYGLIHSLVWQLGFINRKMNNNARKVLPFLIVIALVGYWYVMDISMGESIFLIILYGFQGFVLLLTIAIGAIFVQDQYRKAREKFGVVASVVLAVFASIFFLFIIVEVVRMYLPIPHE